MQKIGVYVGSFNPFHIGHHNVVVQALQLFSGVVIGRGVNPEKQQNQQPEITRTQLNKWFPRSYIHFRSYTGLTTDFLYDVAIEFKKPIVLIRGLRSGYDLDKEIVQLKVMLDMDPNLRCTFIVCDPAYNYVSSTIVRQIQQLVPEMAKYYLP